MKRAQKAAAIAARLHKALTAAETGQDQSITRLGRLAQALIQTRKAAGLSPTVGQPVFDALSRAMAAQIESQKAMVELHEALAEVKGSTTFRSVAIGGLEKSDEPVPRPSGLSLVEKAA